MMKPEPSEVTWRGAFGIWAQEILEQVFQRRAGRQIGHGGARRRLQGLGGGDVDHGGQQLGGQIGEGIRRGPRRRRNEASARKGRNQQYEPHLDRP